MVFSCDNMNSHEKDFLNDIITTHPEFSNYTWIVIIPEVGCNGCIQEGEYFLKTHISEKSICYILTNIRSIKILQQKTGIKIKEQNNVYIDKDNIFTLPSNNSIYPCVAKIKNHQVISVEFQCPDNAAFRNLEEVLLED